MSGRILADGGFTLLEMMISALMTSLLVGTLYAFYHSQVVSTRIQEAKTNAREQVEIGLDFMMKELRSAGARPAPYDPACTVAPSTVAGCTGFARIAAAASTSITFRLDFHGDAASEPPDGPNGCPDDANEEIRYVYDATAATVERISIGDVGDDPPVLISNVSPGGFGLFYFDAAGGELIPGAGGLSAAQRAVVSTVTIELSTRAPRVAPSMPGPLDFPRRGAVFLRNPAC